MIKRYDIYLVVVVIVLKKNLLALKWAQLGLKRGQNEVLGHFHCQNAFFFAYVAYHDGEQCYLVGSDI